MPTASATSRVESAPVQRLSMMSKTSASSGSSLRRVTSPSQREC
ncbi:hypothetical protein [Nocardia sp. NBC_01377]